jgi:hypothetical protein
MNRRDLVFVASRLIALYLLIPTLLQLLSFPFDFYLMHSIGRGTFPGSKELVHFYGHALPGELLTDTVKLIIGWRFWKCSPVVERLFSE